MSIGQRLGRYLLLEKIGEGGMGVVFRARDENLQRDVAIKVIPPGSLQDPQARKRFRNEALALSRLNHPHIAAVYDFDTANDVDFLVLELVAGEGLDQRLTQGDLTETEVLLLATQLADALEAAHKQGVIHRDLKPANLRLTSSGQLKVLDFGLAQLGQPDGPAGEMRTQTTTASTGGTLPYMSPEQLRGGVSDARSDIWAAGCVIYELCTRRRPFGAENAADLTAAILNQPPPPIPSRPARISSRLQDVVFKCLEKEPAARYQSASDLAQDLRRLAVGAAPVFALRRVPPRGVAVALVLLLALAAGAWWLATRSRTSAGDIRAIAVLPLSNVSGDPANDFFADGMTEALITDLSKVGALRVISRTSVMRYKGASKPLSEIARELDVQAVVEGSVMRVGDRVRITAQLVRADPETSLWANDYQGEMRDVLNLQRSVAEAVAREVRVKLTSDDQSRMAAPRQVDPRAYESYLRGLWQKSRINRASAGEALQHFQNAIAIDPNYAPAYAGVAEIEAFSLPSATHLPLAKTAAERAIQLDPNNADAHLSLGLVHLYYEWDWPAAKRSFERAVSLDPGSASIRSRYMIYLWSVGRFQEAIQAGEQARQLDPFSVAVNVDLARAYYFARRYDEAVRQARKTLELDPNNSFTRLVLALIYQMKGMQAEAIEEIVRAQALAGRTESAESIRAAFRRGGYPEALQAWVQVYERAAQQGSAQPWSVAAIYAQIGNRDKTMEWLNRAYEEKTRAIVLTKSDPQLDSMRSDPRFVELIRRIGIP